MRTFLACTTILLFLTTIGCSRELTSGDDVRQRPFNFNRFPADDAMPSPAPDAPPGSGVGTEGVQPAVNPQDLLQTSDDPALQALITAGRDAMMQAQWEDAVQAFEQVVERDDDNTIALYNLGLSYRRLQDYPKAIEYARRAVESNPDELFVNQGLGKAYLESGDEVSAMSSFEAELERHPGDSRVANVAFELARLKLNRGLNEEAYDAARMAVELQGDDPANHAILGQVHMSNGAYDQAIESFQHAVNLAPDEALYRKLLGDALWEAGRKDEAFRMYNDAIEADPDIRDDIPDERLQETEDSTAGPDDPM